MSFEAPWILLIALPLLVAVWWLSRRSYAQLAPAARWGSVILRALLLLCLLAAIAQPAINRESQRSHVVFLLDASRSISDDNLDAAMEEIAKLAREATSETRDTRISIIAFGEEPHALVAAATGFSDWSAEDREALTYRRSLPELYRERTGLISSGAAEDARAALDARIERVEAFRDAAVGEHTDIDRAMRLALNIGPTAEARSIYLYSDANFNRGAWADARSAANEAAAETHVVALDRPIEAEVAAVDLVLPQRVRINEGFSADLRIASSIATDAAITIYKDGFAIQELEATLKEGENDFLIEGLYFREKGFHTVTASVRSADDTQVANNSVRALAVVPGEARVLYVDGDETQIPYLQGALELEGMQVEGRPAGGVPRDLSELLSFDVFILCNVPSEHLSHRQMEMIRSYVEDFGGGFMMLGGDESFGLGGYFDTPIEEVLPVRMPIQKDLLRPSLAIALVIDKSGSMTGAKIELAKRAALATADAINPRDQLGVIGFDGASRVILELTPAGDRGAIAARIAALEAGGGTFLYPALEDAHARLLESNARRKHVVVLSDGQTQGFGYEALVTAMAADGITLSAVGIGEGADMHLMEGIALAGGGRAYFTNDIQSIPQIFTREALRASKSMLVERLLEPIVVEEDASLEEIDTEAMPLLMGYVATTPRAEARTIIISDAGDPILAKWRYGLGRSAAFTSNTKPDWAEDWIQWPDFAKFWAQLVRSIAGEDLAAQYSIELAHARSDDGVRIYADVVDTAGNFISGLTLECSAADAAGRAAPIAVRQTAPGSYEATLPDIDYGEDRQLIWRIAGGGPAAGADDFDEAAVVPYGFLYSYSPEYQTLGPNRALLDELASSDVESLSRVGETTLRAAERAAEESIPLWPYLLITALLLAPLDILCRRLG